MSQFGGDFGLESLYGKSLAIISDVRFTGKGGGTVVERLLSISGEDTLDVNRKYKPPVSTKLGTRIHLISNEMPELTDASGAIIGRLIVLISTHSWLGKEDHELEERLVEELPGILNWALKGLARLNQNKGRFTRVPSAEEAITAMRDLASPVAAFVRERCVLDSQSSIAVDEIYAAYKIWAKENEYKRLDKALFGRNLRAAFPSVKKKRHRNSAGRREPVYTGIDWCKDGDDDDESEQNGQGGQLF